MPEYGFSRIFRHKDTIEDTGKYRSEKTHVLVYFTQWLIISYFMGKTWILVCVFMKFLLLRIFKNFKVLKYK